MTNRQRENVYFSIIGFFIGALAGGVSALLMAPKSGQQTRKMLAKTGRQAYRNSKEKVGAASDITEKLRKRMRTA